MTPVARGCSPFPSTRDTWLYAAVVSIVLVSWPALARGEDTTRDAAAAQALFDEGKRLMAQGKYTDACVKFEESQRLDPGVGTMLWLADCHAKVGRTATAWALFQEAEALANKTNDPRAAVAREEAEKLAPQLSRLVVDVPPETQVPGLEVRRDGVVLGRALWNLAVPTDPGGHVVVATAPGKKSWTGRVTLDPGGSVIVTVPALETDAVQRPSPPPDRPDAAPKPAGRTQTVAGLTLAGLGVVALGVGAGFGLHAAAKKNDSDAHCNDRNVCDATGLELRDDAFTAATVSTWAFVGAAVTIAGGLVLYFTAPRPTATATATVLGGGAPLAISF